MTSWQSVYQAFHANGYTYFFGSDVNNGGADGLKLLAYDGAAVSQISWSNGGGDDFFEGWGPVPTPVFIDDTLFFRNTDSGGTMNIYYARNGSNFGTLYDQNSVGTDIISSMTALNGNLYMNFSDSAAPTLTKLYRYHP